MASTSTYFSTIRPVLVDRLTTLADEEYRALVREYGEESFIVQQITPAAEAVLLTLNCQWLSGTSEGILILPQEPVTMEDYAGCAAVRFDEQHELILARRHGILTLFATYDEFIGKDKEEDSCLSEEEAAAEMSWASGGVEIAD